VPAVHLPAHDQPRACAATRAGGRVALAVEVEVREQWPGDEEEIGVRGDGVTPGVVRGRGLEGPCAERGGVRGAPNGQRATGTLLGGVVVVTVGGLERCAAAV
jgi:hypothetical protein